MPDPETKPTQLRETMKFTEGIHTKGLLHEPASNCQIVTDLSNRKLG